MSRTCTLSCFGLEKPLRSNYYVRQLNTIDFKKESCNEAMNNQWKSILRERSRDTSESSDTYWGRRGWRNIIMLSHSSLNSMCLLHLLTSPGEFHVLSLHSQPHPLSSIAFSFSSSPPLPLPSHLCSLFLLEPYQSLVLFHTRLCWNV